MIIQSYRQYLDFLEKTLYKKTSKLKKSLILVLILGLVTAGTFSAFFVYYTKKISISHAQNQYLELANAGFFKTKQSLDETISLFKVAGTKVQVASQLKDNQEATSSYFLSLDQTQKVLSRIEAVKGNISFQKTALQKTDVPQVYSGLNADLITFYQETENILDKIYKDHQFIKDIHMALGPSPYLASISDESLWKEGREDQIKNYYQNTKSDVNKALDNFSKLNVPEDFKAYYDAQVSYLELLANVSTNILSTLSSDKPRSPDSATRLEEAYQILIGAKRENDVLSQELLLENEKLTALKGNLNYLAAVNLKQNSLEERLSDAVSDAQGK